MNFLEDIRTDLNRDGVLAAVSQRDTSRIFDWLLTAFSYQGISDEVARSYIKRHGNASWEAITHSLENKPPCPLLRSHWDFECCRYDKTNFTCAHPDLIDRCPLPRHRLRNGRLNQTAFSLYLFVRDVADGDFVGWIDERLATKPHSDDSSQEWLIGPLRNVFGVADKVLTMTLSALLLGASEGRQAWLAAGKDMIAVDTLVHNFLHRTGILHDCNAEHPYGARCYAKGGCADIIRGVATQIDASAFNCTYSRIFPRFVQHAIWRFCAADGLDVCNGNRTDDRKSCENRYCILYKNCSKTPLYHSINSNIL